MHLLLRPNGSKLWRFKYRFAGKERQLAFGPYPDVSLAEARDRHDDARRALRAGTGHMDERRRAERERTLAAANSFRTITVEWYELNAPRWAAGHGDRVKRSLDRDVFPELGDTPITALDTPMLLDLEELRALLDSTETSGASPVTLLASRLLALTAVRPGVVPHARWADFHGIDFEASTSDTPFWHIPAAAMKSAQDLKEEEVFDYIVPLTPAAVDVLLEIHRLTGRAPFVFPGQRHAQTPMSDNAIGYFYNRSGCPGRHVSHGWRAAFSTIMNEQAERAGVSGDRAVIDLMLAHVPKDKVKSAYNREQFTERRREIAEAWAAMLMEGARPADDLLSLARRQAG